MPSNSKSKQVRSVKKSGPTIVGQIFTYSAIIIFVGLFIGGVAALHNRSQKSTVVEAAPVVQTVFSDSCKRRISEAWTNGYQAAKND